MVVQSSGHEPGSEKEAEVGGDNKAPNSALTEGDERRRQREEGQRSIEATPQPEGAGVPRTHPSGGFGYLGGKIIFVMEILVDNMWDPRRWLRRCSAATSRSFWPMRGRNF